MMNGVACGSSKIGPPAVFPSGVVAMVNPTIATTTAPNANSSCRPLNGPMSPRFSGVCRNAGRWSATQMPDRNVKRWGSSDSQSIIIAMPIATTSSPPMIDTARPWRTSGRRIAGARSKANAIAEEREAEPGGVRDQQDRALGDGRRRRSQRQDPAEDDPDAGRPADREDRAEPERGEPAAPRGHEAPTEPLPEPAATRGCERHRTRGGRDRFGGARVERPPGPLEDRDPHEPGQADAQDHEDQAADPAELVHVLGEAAGGIRGGDAQQREDGPETQHVGEAVAERRPARRRCPGRARRHRHRGQLADVRGDERQHAR